MLDGTSDGEDVDAGADNEHKQHERCQSIEGGSVPQVVLRDQEGTERCNVVGIQRDWDPKVLWKLHIGL